MTDIDELYTETKQIMTKGKYPEIFKQLSKVFEVIKHQQTRIQELETIEKAYEALKKAL